MNYEIKELRKIAVSELQISAEALGMNPGGDGDRESLRVSIDDVGLLEPITVSRHEGATGGWKVLDGAGRLGKLFLCGVAEVECLVVECSDWNKYVLSKNTMGRGRSAGCRIMSYLVMHRVEVLAFRREEAARQEGAPHVRGHLTEGAYFSAQSIARRLGYQPNNEDVGLGIQLLWCESEGVDHRNNELDAAERVMLRKTLNDVLRGQTPIRRWKAGIAGTVTGSQEGVAGQRSINYRKLAKRAATSMATVMEYWHAVVFECDEDRIIVETKFGEAIKNTPDELRAAVTNGISQWREIDKMNLFKQLKSELGK